MDRCKSYSIYTNHYFVSEGEDTACFFLLYETFDLHSLYWGGDFLIPKWQTIWRFFSLYQNKWGLGPENTCNMVDIITRRQCPRVVILICYFWKVNNLCSTPSIPKQNNDRKIIWVQDKETFHSILASTLDTLAILHNDGSLINNPGRSHSVMVGRNFYNIAWDTFV